MGAQPVTLTQFPSVTSVSTYSPPSTHTPLVSTKLAPQRLHPHIKQQTDVLGLQHTSQPGGGAHGDTAAMVAPGVTLL